MNKEDRCLEEELTNHIKINYDKHGDPINKSNRLCNNCCKPLPIDRYFQCTKCIPELGEDLGDIFSGAYDKSSRRKK